MQANKINIMSDRTTLRNDKTTFNRNFENESE